MCYMFWQDHVTLKKCTSFFCMYFVDGSNKNERQGYLRGRGVCKGGRCVRLITFMCWLSRNSGILKLLEPLGPIHTFNGIAIPLLFVDDQASVFPICDTYVSSSQNAGSTTFFEQK